MGTDVPLPEPAFGMLSVNGDTGYWYESIAGQAAFDADQMRAYAAVCVAAELERWQKWACLKEWDNVNDPPCHPGDKDWRPCANCVGPNAPPTAAPQSPAP